MINSDNFHLYCDLTIEKTYPYGQLSNASIYLTAGKVRIRIDETPESPIYSKTTQLIKYTIYGSIKRIFSKFCKLINIFTHEIFFLRLFTFVDSNGRISKKLHLGISYVFE